MITAALLALAAAQPLPETRIPFFAADGAIDRQIVGKRDVYVRSKLGTWYHARTQDPCSRLSTATAINYETAPNGDLDRHSAIIVEGQRCQLESLVAEAPPPRPKRR